MLRNMGPTDRRVRVVIGVMALVVSLVFCWGSTLGTIVGVALLLVAGVMLVTAAVGYCPTYQLVGISSNPTFHRTSNQAIGTDTKSRHDAEKLLDERFARGEIDEDEFARRREFLSTEKRVSL
jgi:uncharacterized membrane protein